jgi:hypothetical protein
MDKAHMPRVAPIAHMTYAEYLAAEAVSDGTSS